MAMELKQEINSDPRKKFHLLRRLKKAAKHAEHLLQLSEACERCDARTRLEAQVCIWRIPMDISNISELMLHCLSGRPTSVG